MDDHNDYKKKVKNLISHAAGVDPSEVNGEAHLEEDLNLGELEVTELLQEVEEMFDIDLAEYKDSLDTVDDLLGAVAECLE